MLRLSRMPTVLRVIRIAQPLSSLSFANMECIFQWLDDLDDAVSAVRLLGERIRKYMLALAFLSTSLLAQLGGVLLALRHPPLALATAMLLFVGLLYGTVTRQHASPRALEIS